MAKDLYQDTEKSCAMIPGIPVRTLEDWEAGRRTPPEYIPRLIEYQMKYEKLINDKEGKGIYGTYHFCRKSADFA